jgi:DNA-binding Xre family transcriptional regulator
MAGRQAPNHEPDDPLSHALEATSSIGPVCVPKAPEGAGFVAHGWARAPGKAESGPSGRASGDSAHTEPHGPALAGRAPAPAYLLPQESSYSVQSDDANSGTSAEEGNCRKWPVPRRAVGRTVPVDGSRLRRARWLAGLTQTECARAAGLSPAHLSLLERGRTTTPGTLRRLAEALQCMPSDLLPSDPVR